MPGLRDQHRGAVCRHHRVRADPPRAASHGRRRGISDRRAARPVLCGFRNSHCVARRPLESPQYRGGSADHLVRIHGVLRPIANLLAAPRGTHRRGLRRSGGHSAVHLDRVGLFSRGTAAHGVVHSGAGRTDRRLVGRGPGGCRRPGVRLARGFLCPRRTGSAAGITRLLDDTRTQARTARRDRGRGQAFASCSRCGFCGGKRPPSM